MALLIAWTGVTVSTPSNGCQPWQVGACVTTASAQADERMN